ncbi:glycosyl hydrolase family 8 [Opitutus sp. ER46]|uniref:glycosyl hydrolase family 8 n=1 Tax=Opitutus sp. ER46 TaxID=2161864 RepID=UPI000D312EA8|nr:glycosyl hydrolase family 8 [Opitutus sp. ER46]PTX91558.1 glycoside hydrolase [Opitutus sp. ER46]
MSLPLVAPEDAEPCPAPTRSCAGTPPAPSRRGGGGVRRGLATFGLAVALLAPALAASPAPRPAATTGEYRNLFREYLGKSDVEVSARIQAAWRQIVSGDPDSQRLFYPVAGGMAYVPDIASNDVRSEGMSYLMMLAVQLNDQAVFDAVWKYARHYMYHESGPFRGYFSWHTAFDGRRLSNGPAPDGEEWFVMALFFASHRWGDGPGVLAYGAEAQQLLRTMLHKHEEPDRGPITAMFDRLARQVNFVPQGPGARFTDPSYHLPAFYELWARWAADPADRAFLAELAPTSREHFRRAAHPKTGLMPDYANFDGTPYVRDGHEDFRYDAWRTLSNPALDYAWWAADPWQIEQSNRVLRFLLSQGPNCPDRFKLDGTPISEDVNSPGLIAMAATAALVADRACGEPFVRQLWELPQPTGRYRYYNGLLTMIALLEVGGQFRIHHPPAAR